MPPEDNMKRRRFLATACGVIGGGGLVALSIPFINYMKPSKAVRAAGAPIEVDISKLQPGEMLTVLWRGRPIWVLHRTKDQIARLQDPKLRQVLRDPDSREPQQFNKAVENDWRSLKPEYLVTVGICTHLGCVPTYRPEVAPIDLGPDWHGGFFCPCHGSRYDLAGRVYKAMPAPLNLPVPPYHFHSETIITIGEIREGEAINWTPKTW